MSAPHAREWAAVVLSPHLDDAALSLGGLIQRLPEPRAVVTVHGGPPAAGAAVSEWDAACGFLSAREAYETRLAEDARACAVLGAEQVLLGHADNPYRCGGPLTAVDAFLAGLPPQTEIFVPLATNQRDHAAVRDRALGLVAGRRPRVYADLPYTAVMPGWGTGSLDPASGGAAYRAMQERYALEVVHDVRLGGAEWARKRDAVLCYASQLAPVAGMSEVGQLGPLLGHPGPLQFELVWEVVPRSATPGPRSAG